MQNWNSSVVRVIEKHLACEKGWWSKCMLQGGERVNVYYPKLKFTLTECANQ